MSERHQFRLGHVGYGEIGSALGRGLRDSGLAEIACYDKYAFGGPYCELIQRRAREASVTLVTSQRDLAERADMILGVTPGSASLESAAGFARHLRPQHVFVDVASATPKVKQGVAERLTGSGAAIADASILGSPRDGHAMAMLTSGPAAERFRDALVPWGMRIEAVGSRIGIASGIKIIRSVLMKGLEAVLVECVLGARRYDIEDVIVESASKALSRPFRDTINALLTTDVIHAGRRSEEAAMSAEALADAGIDPIVTRAIAARLRWVAELGVKEHFKGIVPKDYKEAVAAIEKLGVPS